MWVLPSSSTSWFRMTSKSCSFASAIEKQGREFCALPENQQEELLSRLAFSSKRSPKEVQGQQFFDLMREYTVMGYYTSRGGLEAIDDPGLKFYTASPECPHKDDPEHRHLPVPVISQRS